MLLSVKGISKSYASGKKERIILSNLDLDVEKGEKIAIVGPSGSGKTTLLNLVGTLDKPDKGEIQLLDYQLKTVSYKEQLHIRNKEIGFIFQFHHLLPYLNVLENVLIPSLPDKRNQQNSLEMAESLLKKVGLWEIRHQKPGELSGGECQRVAVIRALINSPSLILADEPTGALDQKNADALMDLLLDLNEQMNVTLLVVTHSAKLAEKMDKRYEISEGRLSLMAN
jgi:ABC-type lipoprotein export system ATPase subunit